MSVRQWTIHYGSVQEGPETDLGETISVVELEDYHKALDIMEDMIKGAGMDTIVAAARFLKARGRLVGHRWQPKQ